MLHLRSYILFLILLFSVVIKSQNNWKQYTTNEGLASNIIQDIFIQDSLNIWIGTNNGLSLINNSVAYNYNSNNTSLNNNNIKEIVYSLGYIWIHTGAGISRFNGRNFVNYTSANGLLSNNVNDIAVDTSGNLWIATNQGVSMFDGVQFHNDSGKIARTIEVDKNNNIYILRYSAIFNIPTITTPIYEIFNGTSWTTYPLTFNFTMSGVRLKKTISNELLIVGSNVNNFLKVDFPFNLTRVYPTWDGQLLNGFNNIEIDPNQRSWITSINNTQNFFVGKDTSIKPFVFNPTNLNFKQIASNYGIVAAGDANGVFINNNNILPKPTELNLDINNIKASVNSLGSFFSSKNNSYSGFEFPKDSNTHLINGASFLIQSRIKGGQKLIYPNNPKILNKTPGPLESEIISNGVYISKIDKSEILRHRQLFQNPNYKPSEGIRDWPAVVLISDSTSIGAPFVDFNSNKIYDPLNGDYPIIKGDQAIYWINHPQDTTVKFEFHGMIYAYSATGLSPINNSIFMRYKIINKSNSDLDSVKIGLYADTEIGYFRDDFVGCDSLNNIMYAYNSDRFDESIGQVLGYGSGIPSVGFQFLSDSMDSFIRDPNPSSPPINQFWEYALNGKDYQNNDIYYPNTTNATKHMLTGNPNINSGWTEASQNAFPWNRLILGSIPYICLMKDSSKTIDLSIGVNSNPNNNSVGSKIPDLINDLNSLIPIYDTINFTSFKGNNPCYLVTDISPKENPLNRNFELFPNPVESELNIQAEKSIQQVELFDIRGTLVLKKHIANQKQAKISLNDILSNGIYFVRVYIDGDIRNQKVVIQR